jgi:hypothetical protein
MITRNTSTLPLASAARTVTTTSPQMRNLYHRGVLVTLAVSVASGTGGLTLHVRGYDAASASGAAFDLLVDAPAITAPGTYVFIVDETAVAGAGVRVAVSRPLTKLWDVQVVAGDGSSYTYSVSAVLLAL